MGRNKDDSKSDASDGKSSSENKSSAAGSDLSSKNGSGSEHSEFEGPGKSSLSSLTSNHQKSKRSNLRNLSDSDSDDEERGKHRGETRKDIGKRAAEDPDLYCIRRSERQRREVPRLNISNDKSSDERREKRRRLSDSEASESDYSEVTRSNTRSTRSTRQTTRSKAPRLRQAASLSSSEAEENDSDSFDSDEEVIRKPKKTGKFAKNIKQRNIRRQPSTLKISYKEESEDITDSDDLIEIDQNEEEDKEANETIEKVVKVRLARKGATGSKTTSYNIEKEGDPNEGFRPEEEEGETQYLIKWKNWAYMHNTWESEAALREQKVNGLKKLENFIKKDEELERWKSYATAEDREYYNCQQELSEDLYEKYCLVERIVCEIPKAGSSSSDYLVKWQGLPYSECTSEDGALILKKFPEAVEQFNERQKSSFLPNKNCKALRFRPKFQALKLQPDYIGGVENLELRDYQLAGLNWLLHSWCKNNGAILADEMGLGKTIQTISFLTVLMNAHGVCGPFLLVVPLSTLVTWQKEFEIWSPKTNVVVYIGDVPSRNLIREHEFYQKGSKQFKFNVIITTYEIVLKDKAILGTIPWAAVGVDEAHRLKNDDSRLYKVLFDFDTSHRIFITGTPLQNSLKELWSLLHFIMPSKFDVWEDFEKRHSSADKTGFRHLHQELEPYLLRRVKKDVEKSLPAKVEQILRVEMTKIQKYYYKLILKRNYKELTKGAKGSSSTFLNIVMELKKCCNHGFLVRPPDDETFDIKNRFELLVKGSGKLLLLDKLLMKFKGAGHRVLIFSQMVRMLDILAEYLQLRHFQYQRLDGTIKGDLRKQAMDHFNAEGSQDFCFLLSTRAGGLGVNLATADTVIIFDSDWNPQNDLQAMARAHRIGQKNQVSVYRLVTKNSVEEDIVERAKKKMVLDHLVIQRMDTTGRTVLSRAGMGGYGSSNLSFNKDELNAILKFGAADIFKESNDDDEDLQLDIDDILRLAETRNTEELKNNATDELLSKFKVVSFDNLEDQELEHNTIRGLPLRDWEDIIPEEERKKMDEEEKMRLLKEHNLPPRNRKTVAEARNYRSDEEEGKRKGRRRIEDDESESSDDDSADGDKVKRKGRAGKEVVKGFNESELRRFLKSFKKFGKPLERLEDIAEDAELQEKSESDLKNLGEMILHKCDVIMKDFEQKLKEAASAEARKAMGRPTFKLGSITVNARSVLQAVNELEPLAEMMPSDQHAREKFQIGTHVKNVHFDCFWGVEDDCRLLRGVFECGFGNWDAIKMDSSYKLQDKILPDGDLKPQGKQLQARTEYLLKVLRKLCEASGMKKKLKPVTGKTSKKIKSKEIVEENAHSDEGSNGVQKEKKENKKKGGTKDQKAKKSHHHHHHHANTSADGPLHFTTNQTVSIQEESGLEPEVFYQCKENMRAVKKSLQYLKSPNAGLSEKDAIRKIRDSLIKIGDHIATILSEYKEPSKIKEWRGFLWRFVAMFTEGFDASRLHKIYKQNLKKREAEQDKLKSEHENNTSSSAVPHYPSTSGSSSKQHHGNDRKEDKRKKDQDSSRWNRDPPKNRDRQPRDQSSSYQRSQTGYGDHRQQQGYRDDRWRMGRFNEHEQPPSNSGNYLPPPGHFSAYQSGYPSYDRNKQGGYQRSSGGFPSSSRDYPGDSSRYYPPRRSYGSSDRREQWQADPSYSSYDPSGPDGRDSNKNFNRKRRHDDSSGRDPRSREQRISKEPRLSPGSRYSSATPLPPPPNPNHPMMGGMPPYDIPLLPPPPVTQYSIHPTP